MEKKSLQKFILKEDGTTSMEYALIGSLIAVIIATAVSAVGEKVRALYEAVLSCFS